MPKLLVKHPEKGESTVALTGDRITLGRRPENDVQINFGTISGRHAELVARNGHYVLRDLDSTNHCYIDGIQVSEAELNERCKLIIGTVECEYIPDPPMATLAAPPPTPSSVAPPDVETLRRTIGILRVQNEELVTKLNDQQSQINILGSARLLTPAAGADLDVLRERVRSLTEERDKLAKDYKALREQVDALRLDAVLSTDHARMKTTVPVNVPPATEVHKGGVSVSPDGRTAEPAPVAKVAARPAPPLGHIAALGKKLHDLAVAASGKATTPAMLDEMFKAAQEIAASASPLGEHPASQLSSGIESLLRDVKRRGDEIEPGLVSTIALATETLTAILVPETLKRCKDLPSPSILAIEDDKELLPAITAALEFCRLPTTGCDDGERGIEALKNGHFDLILLDAWLPGVSASEFCSRIHSLPSHGRTPVVFLNGDCDAVRNGASDVIGKPFNMFELTVKAHTWALKKQLAIE